jgi:hypothetical protein
MVKFTKGVYEINHEYLYDRFEQDNQIDNDQDTG